MARADPPRAVAPSIIPGPNGEGCLPPPTGGSRPRGRTIFLCIPSGTPAANLLRTGFFPLLRDAEEVGCIVILSPLVREAHFREEFEHPKVRFEELLSHAPGWLERRIIRILQERYVKTMQTESMRIRVARERRLELGEARYLDRGGLGDPSTRGRRLAMAAIKRLPLSLPLLFEVSDRLTLGDRYAALFERERPDLLVTPTTGIYFGEGPLMARADRARVPILAVDLSWDHFTTKTAPLRRVAGLAVWNEAMCRQAIEIHGYRPEQLCVAGVPQFDLYAEPATYLPRDDFLRAIGADPAKRLLALTTIPPVLYAFHEVVIDELLAAIRAGRLGPAQLLVRLHPRDDLARYERFVDLPDVIVEKPFRETIVAEGSNVDPSRGDRLHLANTLKHSDVVLNVQSTITIESAIVDTPVVNIGFDGHAQRDFLDSARRYYRYTHYKPLIDAGAARVALSPDEMIQLTRQYLDRTELDREGRRRAVAEQCFQVDGKAAERVAEFVLRSLIVGAHGVRPPRARSRAGARRAPLQSR